MDRLLGDVVNVIDGLELITAGAVTEDWLHDQ